MQHYTSSIQTVRLNPIEASAAIRERSLRECKSTLAIWEQRIDFLIRAIDALQGMRACLSVADRPCTTWETRTPTARHRIQQEQPAKFREARVDQVDAGTGRRVG